MKSKHLILAFVLAILILSTIASAAPNNEKKKRIIAHNDKEVADAVAKALVLAE